VRARESAIRLEIVSLPANEKLPQHAKSNREFRQGGGDVDLRVTIAFRQFQSFPRKDVPALFATSARQQNVRVLPDPGSDWRKIGVNVGVTVGVNVGVNAINQAGHQARNNHHYARVFELPRERDNMIRFRAGNR
jgi:hypothetical protein